MIIVRLMGGLGNQMFQYAFGKALSLREGVELKLDVSLLGELNAIKNHVVRHFDLDVFNLQEKFATREEVENFNGKMKPGVFDRLLYSLNRMLNRYPLIVQRDHVFDTKQISGIGKDACIVGRWQSELYFKDYEREIRNSFSLSRFIPNSYSLSLSKEMDSALSVAVHVRRKDYVDHPQYSRNIGALDKQYYINAISYFRKKTQNKDELRFYFISDDMAWCRENFLSVENAFFVEQEEGKAGYLSDLWLLTKCRNSIISNSTFSWWGAWLGEKEDSTVLAPKTWARDMKFIPQNGLPDRWVKIENKF